MTGKGFGKDGVKNIPRRNWEREPHAGGGGDSRKCGKDLSCSGSVTSTWSRYIWSFCYDKSASPKVGDKCDKDETVIDDHTRHPHEGYPFPKRYMPAKDKKKGSQHALKCLPKGKDLVCQEEAWLFEYCSAKENIECEKGLVCSPILSICLGEDEII